MLTRWLMGHWPNQTKILLSDPSSTATKRPGAKWRKIRINSLHNWYYFHLLNVRAPFTDVLRTFKKWKAMSGLLVWSRFRCYNSFIHYFAPGHDTKFQYFRFWDWWDIYFFWVFLKVFFFFVIFFFVNVLFILVCLKQILGDNSDHPFAFNYFSIICSGFDHFSSNIYFNNL